jgi:hypothetical protein
MPTQAQVRTIKPLIESYQLRGALLTAQGVARVRDYQGKELGYN